MTFQLQDRGVGKTKKLFSVEKQKKENMWEGMINKYLGESK